MITFSHSHFSFTLILVRDLLFVLYENPLKASEISFEIADETTANT